MEPEALKKLIQAGPLRITMNSGEVFDVAGAEFALVSDYELTVLTKGYRGWYNATLAIVNIASAVPIGETAT